MSLELDERALRKPEFVEGEPIRLGDGHVWHFPRPIVEAYAVPDASGHFRFDGIRRRQFGAEFDRKLDAFRASDGLADQMEALLNLAVDLLSRNYDLKADEFAQLLVWRPGDDDNFATWQAIADVAGGYAPKAEAVGSA
jgi:hypothetical protein